MLSSNVAYDPKLAYGFAMKDANTTYNDYILNWIEAVWATYFAVVFCLFGNELERFSN